LLSDVTHGKIGVYSLGKTNPRETSQIVSIIADYPR
jgi:hypothetical protein